MMFYQIIYETGIGEYLKQAEENILSTGANEQRLVL